MPDIIVGALRVLIHWTLSKPRGIGAIPLPISYTRRQAQGIYVVWQSRSKEEVELGFESWQSVSKHLPSNNTYERFWFTSQ